jgi:phosphoribosylformylglycinamidine synthase
MYASAPMSDVTKKLTPDIKCPGESMLFLMDLGLGKNRLGGSALAQSLGQIGDECPDIEAPLLARGFLAMQEIVRDDVALAAHDRSDGGLFTTVAEMCMASHCGFNLFVPENLDSIAKIHGALFSQEIGWVLEVEHDKWGTLRTICEKYDIHLRHIGATQDDPTCVVLQGTTKLYEKRTPALRHLWEETSYQLESTPYESSDGQG